MRVAVSGTPISLLKEPTGATVGPASASTWASRSLVLVLPDDPVMPMVTRPPGSASATRAVARAARRGERVVDDQLRDVEVELGADEHGARSCCDGCRCEVVAVDPLPGQRDEQLLRA